MISYRNFLKQKITTANLTKKYCMRVLPAQFEKREQRRMKRRDSGKSKAL